MSRAQTARPLRAKSLSPTESVRELNDGGEEGVRRETDFVTIAVGSATPLKRWLIRMHGLGDRANVSRATLASDRRTSLRAMPTSLRRPAGSKETDESAVAKAPETGEVVEVTSYSEPSDGIDDEPVSLRKSGRSTDAISELKEISLLMEEEGCRAVNLDNT
jgi:hypothetical protein